MKVSYGTEYHSRPVFTKWQPGRLTRARRWRSTCSFDENRKKRWKIKGFSLANLGRENKNSAAMNKAELIDAIQAALGKDATKRSADEALEAVLSSIAKGVKKDKKVQIIGFGTFEVKKRAARQGRNPKTGESMKIAASKSVGFKPSSVLKSSL